MKKATMTRLITLLIITLVSGIGARAQTCDLQFTASLGGCDNVFTSWTTKRIGAVGITLTFDNLLTGEQKIVPLSGGTRSYSLTGVGPGAHFNVLIVMDFGTDKCSATLHDLHNRPPEQCGNAFAPLSVLNAASYRTYTTADSWAVAFGDGITTETKSAPSLPLPTLLGGVQVSFDGVNCELLFVSPKQINFRVPQSAVAGLRSVRATNSAGQIFTGQIYIQSQGPGVFTKDQTGEGPAAATYGSGFLSLWVTGVNPQGLRPDDVFLRTPKGTYPAVFVEGADGKARQFIGTTQINFLNVPIEGQGAELIVAGVASQGFTLQR